MDKNIAAALVASLLERIEKERTIGAVSSLERQALHLAWQQLNGGSGPMHAAPADPLVPPPDEVPTMPPEPAEAAAPTNPTTPQAPTPAALALASIERDEVTDPNLLLCLDFGTAMSKAFATVFPDEYVDLELGAAAGRQGYPIPSSVFISDKGRAYFGFEAIDMSEDLMGTGRQRLDSIKSWVSLQTNGNVKDLDGESSVLSKLMNPTDLPLTRGDLLRIYLAFLTDMAEQALEARGVKDARHAKRRFARPCWPDASQAQWADALMRTMLAEAQILADTFNARWAGGIPVEELKSALDQVKSLGRRPGYLIDDGVPEPVAVAAGAFAAGENQRDAFMVVDVGAGTTDFGLFITAHRPDDGELRVFQVAASIQGVMQAGDKVDDLLRGYIAQRESIDPSDSAGQMNFAELTRRRRSLKETLFRTGRVEYQLADGTASAITREDFLADDKVVRFGHAVEAAFTKSLEAVDETWLRWLAMDRVRLHVVLTGGSSPLPMMQALGSGPIDVKGHRIQRESVDARPLWMDDMPGELLAVYPQLAVAIGGTAETLPETLDAPPIFAGGTRRHGYVAGNLPITGS
jgi:molecular chaperone HscA